MEILFSNYSENCGKYELWWPEIKLYMTGWDMLRELYVRMI